MPGFLTFIGCVEEINDPNEFVVWNHEFLMQNNKATGMLVFYRYGLVISGPTWALIEK
ncbi:hypothetical protein GCM10028825_08180 [Spirosoma agri]